MRFDYDDTVIYRGHKGKVLDSTSDETLVKFESGACDWLYTEDLESGD